MRGKCQLVKLLEGGSRSICAPKWAGDVLSCDPSSVCFPLHSKFPTSSLLYFHLLTGHVAEGIKRLKYKEYQQLKSWHFLRNGMFLWWPILQKQGCKTLLCCTTAITIIVYDSLSWHCKIVPRYVYLMFTLYLCAIKFL